MKTAQEWTDKANLEIQFLIRENPPNSEITEREIDFYKQIQLDAWKQGMSDAAEIANITMQGRSSMVNQTEWLHEIFKNILTARDNKTSV